MVLKNLIKSYKNYNAKLQIFILIFSPKYLHLIKIFPIFEAQNEYEVFLYIIYTNIQ